MLITKFFNKVNNKKRRILQHIKKSLHPDYDESPTPSLTPNAFDFLNQNASDYIYSQLITGVPCMISRFGSVELNAITRCLAKQSNKKLFNYLNDNIDEFFYTEDTFDGLFNNAGFFPVTENSIQQFTSLYLDSMKDIDILGSWHYKEKYVKNYLQDNIKRIPLWYLEPYHFDNPAWSRVLKNKTVLVIHPFAKTIEKQYKQREKLFQNPDILPEFNLKTITAVQSIAGTETEFSTWFDALKSMEAKISHIDFDIALIGCGAYGLPLASYIKRMGKQAIHLGGAIQILFGIHGKRWDGVESYQKFFNSYWCRPDSEEIPQKMKIVEGGCYW